MNKQRSSAPKAGWPRRVWLTPLLLACATAWGSQPPADGGSARGVLRATAEATLSSSVSEKILSMPLREGERFKQGDVLVSFDCRRLEAELRAARAGAAVEARNAKVQAELLRMAATGRADADIARFKHQERQAQAEVIQQRMVDCKVVAPYAGSVVETLARLDETPPANEKLISIVSDGPMELHMVVPSKWLAWLKEGSDLDFIVDETGDVLPAKVTRVSAAVDAVSQTIKVVALVEQAPVGVLPGMSGRATLEGAAAAPGTPMASTPGPAPAGKLPVQAVYHVPAGSEGQPPAVMPIPSVPTHATPVGSSRVGTPGSSTNGVR
ncbi:MULTISPECIES: efflux RND transporter periplasmic adaptor subunit [Achromobacter]|uniref:Efflux RND transporter periplasmic adaptor subunit n=1 Tax=Achromobacter spanius TaxID=217203 RepID=A0ABY8GQM3_9BURK|nr:MULTISPECIES: efflux RND transporter periplasmic adaptor subunit [Achromobacter]WAI83882.1 efflux RND transporter periplasmic adaptor subunit [Achromobacter spanius]WEX93962.1 efflux RND transporter periplasmic adaptor subunit [Achromobacter sp. SS2-2022]WFP06873.1 efflux RND transporter periplasmic adaptor subunit [Achromobacter spanius]